VAPADTDPHFFTVKVWRNWVRRFGPVTHVEQCILMVRAVDPDEARRRAYESKMDLDGLETEFEGAPIRLEVSGVDGVYDTGRHTLADFAADPLVYSELHEVDEDSLIDYYDPGRIARPEPRDLEPEDTAGLPDELDPVRDGERWFGVKFWRTWSLAGEDPCFLEELVLAVPATSPDEADRRATELAVAADTDVVNDRGELVHVRTVNRDYVYDTLSATVVTLEDREVFGQLFELNPDGSVEFFDPDNDLPFREGAIPRS
jgi:hypothetical protein